MKKLIRLIVVLTIALVVFKMVDEENYMRVKSLINSLRIYNEKGTDRYYLIYDLDEKMKDLEGSMVYLHGRPLKSQLSNLCFCLYCGNKFI